MVEEHAVRLGGVEGQEVSGGGPALLVRHDCSVRQFLVRPRHVLGNVREHAHLAADARPRSRAHQRVPTLT
eukprot:COSAG06_NODE_12639_length_1349_cov_2.499200_2_plen_71_part_00